MNALRQQADLLREACQRLRRASAEFDFACRRFRAEAKREKRARGPADVVDFKVNENERT
jgi:hypothetical protein